MEVTTILGIYIQKQNKNLKFSINFIHLEKVKKTSYNLFRSVDMIII